MMTRFAILLVGAGGAGAVLAGCGGSSHPAATTTAAASTAVGTTTAPARPRIHVTLTSPTHRPKVNVPWPVKITVTDAAGKPVAATLTMQVMFNGTPVGKIDNGAVYRFVGSWQERPDNGITWPPASRGQPITFQAVVKAQGVTVRKNWWIKVR
jgi:hypothetical protein